MCQLVKLGKLNPNLTYFDKLKSQLCKIEAVKSKVTSWPGALRDKYGCEIGAIAYLLENSSKYIVKVA